MSFSIGYIENATVALKNKKLPFHEYGSEMNLFFYIGFCLFVCSFVLTTLHTIYMLEIWMIRLCPLETTTYESTSMELVQREDLYFTHAKGLKCDQNVANGLLLSNGHVLI